MQYLWNQSNHDAPVTPVVPVAPDPNADVCSVCLHVPGTKNVSITACGHKYCTSCLLLSLKTNNKCPMCRAEIEPARETIEPVSVTIASELIRDEERNINMTKRLGLINSFSGTNGRATMIFSLCRELAFATAHSIARWQNKSTETYDVSWHNFDSSDDDNDDMD